MSTISFSGIEKINPIHSTVDGNVTEVFVDTGDTARNGDVLMVGQIAILKNS